MPVYQTVILICEVCGETSLYTEEVDLHSDHIIHVPDEENWDYPISKPNTLHCPDCYKKEGNKHEGGKIGLRLI